MRRLSIALVALAWMGCGADDAEVAPGPNVTPGIDAGNPTPPTPDAGPTAPQACATPPCSAGEACVVPGDCKSNLCTNNLCQAGPCEDGVKNNDETDVDCGGSCIAGCGPTKTCNVNADCVDRVCGGGICTPPTAGDGIKNGNESDVDCGSSTDGRFDTKAARCDAGKACKADNDCKSGGCNDQGRCVFARSCKREHGGRTCGVGDVKAPNRVHEDCCASAEVPAYAAVNGFSNPTAFRLDKYTITSGRMRAFLDAVQGNVKGWVQANRTKILAPEQLLADFDDFLPTGWVQAASNDQCTGGEGNYDCNYGALAHVSGFRYNSGPGGVNGYACDMKPDNYGARTFYMTDAERAMLKASTGMDESQHVVPQSRVEQKALDCADYYILAAFCAWDGGRLETLAEYNYAYRGNGTSGQTYPWPRGAGSEFETRALGFADALSPFLFPYNGFTPSANTMDPPLGDDALPGRSTTVDERRYYVFNPAFTPAEKSTYLQRLRRANAFFNYANYITTNYFQELGDTTALFIGEEDINQAHDQSVAVSPPGRYPSGYGVYGHADLLGNVFEITATPGGGAPALTRNGTVEWTRNGSYETAHFNQDTMTSSTNAKALLTKYARAGGRCARPNTIYLPQPLP